MHAFSLLLLNELLELSLLLHRHQTEDEEWELPLHSNVRELSNFPTATSIAILAAFSALSVSTTHGAANIAPLQFPIVWDERWRNGVRSATPLARARPRSAKRRSSTRSPTPSSLSAPRSEQVPWRSVFLAPFSFF